MSLTIDLEGLQGTGPQLEQPASRPTSASEPDPVRLGARAEVERATTIGYATAMRSAGVLALLDAGVSFAGTPGRKAAGATTGADSRRTG